MASIRFPVLAQVVVSNAPVVVGFGIVRVYLDGLVVILDGPLVLAQFVVSKTPVVVGLGIVRSS